MRLEALEAFDFAAGVFLISEIFFVFHFLTSTTQNKLWPQPNPCGRESSRFRSTQAACGPITLAQKSTS